MKLLVKLIIVLIVITIYPTCKKEGYSRFLNITCKIKVFPDTSHIRMGDTIKIIAWIPYHSYDNYSGSFVDVKNMEVDIWGSLSFRGLDSGPIPNQPIITGSPIFENYFTRYMVSGDFANYPQNHSIKYFEKREACFYFEMRLIANKKWAFKFNSFAGRGFMSNKTWKVDISSSIVNSQKNHFIFQNYTPFLSVDNNDYFFKTY